MNYAALYMAIVLEIMATSFLNLSEGMTRPLFVGLSLLGYISCFFFMSWAMKTLPVGLVYATWSGLGIIGITSIGYFYFKESIDLIGLIGIGFILAGVVLLNLFSKTVLR